MLQKSFIFQFAGNILKEFIAALHELLLMLILGLVISLHGTRWFCVYIIITLGTLFFWSFLEAY